MSESPNNLAAYIWSLADLLRGDFKQSQYGRVILHFNQATVKAFADTISICPGIVTGRLQHDEKLPHTSHMLRSQLKWAESV